MSLFFGVVLILLGVAIYFIPALIAYRRAHPNRVSITIVNIAFGWTLLGWIVALAWACSAIANKAAENTAIQPELRQFKFTKQCPDCAEEVLLEARKCKHCGTAISAA
jgi:cytochrome c biogenesis protein CcdA